jgi:glutaconate CoA-transferase subunit A
MEIEDPFNPGKKVLLVPALNPDVSILHAQKVDEMGNVMLEGCLFHEPEMVRASKKVLVTCEEIVSSEQTRKNPERTTIPYVYVTAIVKQPWGAHPTSVYGYYDYDEEHLSYYQECARARGEKYERYLDDYVYASETFDKYLEKVGGVQRLEKLRMTR